MLANTNAGIFYANFGTPKIVHLTKMDITSVKNVLERPTWAQMKAR